MNNDRIKPGMFVKHFKRENCGTEPRNLYVYKVIDTTAVHTETKERMVIYEAQYGNAAINVVMGGWYIRPYDIFMSEVDHEKYPDIKQQYRFEPLSREDMQYLSEVDWI